MQRFDDLGPTLCAVARDAVARAAAGLPPDITRPALGPASPVFVTLRTLTGALRGCVGTLTAVEANVVAETARSARLAATQDPRFTPVLPEEVADLSIEISVLHAHEIVVSLSELDPSRYGVVVRDTEERRGVLLPGIPGVTDAAQQVGLASKKAGIPPGAEVTLERFLVRKFG